MHVLALLLTACTVPVVQKDDAPAPAASETMVAPETLLNQRVYIYRTDVLPGGDVMKRWYWDRPWEIKSGAGTLIRQMRTPDLTDKARADGPHVTVIQDSSKGTIYEALFIQQTDRAFTLPITLYFFESREAQTPLFSLPLTDATTRRCQQAKVSRGDIKVPGISQALFESAKWVAVGWDRVPFAAC